LLPHFHQHGIFNISLYITLGSSVPVRCYGLIFYLIDIAYNPIFFISNDVHGADSPKQDRIGIASLLLTLNSVIYSEISDCHVPERRSTFCCSMGSEHAESALHLLPAANADIAAFPVLLFL
jgi:hypothetical protein